MRTKALRESPSPSTSRPSACSWKSAPGTTWISQLVLPADLKAAARDALLCSGVWPVLPCKSMTFATPPGAEVIAGLVFEGMAALRSTPRLPEQLAISAFLIAAIAYQQLRARFPLGEDVLRAACRLSIARVLRDAAVDEASVQDLMNRCDGVLDRACARDGSLH